LTVLQHRGFLSARKTVEAALKRIRATAGSVTLTWYPIRREPPCHRSRWPAVRRWSAAYSHSDYLAGHNDLDAAIRERPGGHAAPAELPGTRASSALLVLFAARGRSRDVEADGRRGGKQSAS